MAPKLHSSQEMLKRILGAVFCILLGSQTCTGAVPRFLELKGSEEDGLSTSRKLLENKSDNSTSTVHSSPGRNKTTDSAPYLKGNSTSTSSAKPIPAPTKAPADKRTSVSATSGQSWCVAKNGVPDSSLQTALDYACGIGGADCGQVQQGGSCFIPDSVFSHASYAFNSYYQKTGMAPGTCDFAGTAVITATDPSYGSCIYSSSAGISMLNGTVPSGGTSTSFSPFSPTTADSARTLVVDIQLQLLLPWLLTMTSVAVILFFQYL